MTILPHSPGVFEWWECLRGMSLEEVFTLVATPERWDALAHWQQAEAQERWKLLADDRVREECVVRLRPWPEGRMFEVRRRGAAPDWAHDYIRLPAVEGWQASYLSRRYHDVFLMALADGLFPSRELAAASLRGPPNACPPPHQAHSPMKEEGACWDGEDGYAFLPSGAETWWKLRGDSLRSRIRASLEAAARARGTPPRGPEAYELLLVRRLSDSGLPPPLSGETVTAFPAWAVPTLTEAGLTAGWGTSRGVVKSSPKSLGLYCWNTDHSPSSLELRFYPMAAANLRLP
jgi:hypothetical protein